MIYLKPYIVSFPLSEDEKAWLRAKSREVAAVFAKLREQEAEARAKSEPRGEEKEAGKDVLRP